MLVEIIIVIFFYLRKDWKWGGKRIYVLRYWYFIIIINEVLFFRILVIWGGYFGVCVNKCIVY